MSFDWTKEELLRELKERKAEGESEEVTFDFVWSVVERAYKEKGQLVGATAAERTAIVTWLRAEVKTERAAVVAWLIERGHYIAEAYAGSIERGEHRREEGE